jgi:predicted amidohydrolase YtcJ
VVRSHGFEVEPTFAWRQQLRIGREQNPPNRVCDAVMEPSRHADWPRSLLGPCVPAQNLGPQRANLLDPCRSALNAGMRISLHSDYNVTSVAPLGFIQTAVTRVMRDGGEVLNPNDRITVHQALKAVTLDAAWQCRKDDITGSIEPGKCADFAVLEKDPTAVDPTTIKSIKVVEIWLDGYKRYAA